MLCVRKSLAMAVLFLSVLGMGAAQSALVMMSQNNAVAPGLVTYQSSGSFPSPLQSNTVLVQTSFVKESLVRAAMQFDLTQITASDFATAGETAAQDMNHIVWQLGWISPTSVFEHADTVILCWDSAVDPCVSGAIEVKPLVDAALASSSNPQALNLESGTGIFTYLGAGGFDFGVWEIRAFIDASSITDTPYTTAYFKVPVSSSLLLLVFGVGLLKRKKL